MSNSTLEKREEKQLKDICEFHNGLWTGKKEPFIECNVIRNANFTKDFKLNYENVVRISVEEKQFQTRELEYGDLILEKSGGGPNQPVGRVVIFDKHEKGYSFSNFTSLIRIKNKSLINFRFLYLYLCHCYLSGMTIKMQKNSTGIRNLLFDEYKSIYVPIPSIEEQQRIVGILDEAFENIEKAKQNTLQNLNNAKELFENLLNETFIKNIEGWNKRTLEEIVSKEQYSMKRGPFGSSLTKSCFVPKGIRVFEQYNSINNDPYWARYYITEDKYEELKAFTAKAGDLLVSCSGVTLGRIVELPDDVESGIINQALLKIKLDNSKILNKFFIYLFRSKDFQNKIFEYSQGVAIPNMVGVKELKKIIINYPSLGEQQKIVQQLDELQEQTKKHEQIYTQKLKDFDELKQSILQKAFNGEL